MGCHKGSRTPQPSHLHGLQTKMPHAELDERPAPRNWAAALQGTHMIRCSRTEDLIDVVVRRIISSKESKPDPEGMLRSPPFVAVLDHV
ncbi:hypothetical protein QCA50_001386 [Cerrena zonata]|uniref:Uncharacterized protein n=1 Tax=Cerrena zonata TaxID=2478898 RepID=A0AAW0GL91_9APHY